jgi:NAD(P)-dependent dehydrogenase (short-subunit alcohol dehydrogenase family)
MANSSDYLNSKRVCLLTGASGTLGTAFCQLFRERYHIAAVWRNRLPSGPSQYSRSVNPIDPSDHLEDSDPVFAIRADLFDQREIQRVVELTLARFGRIDLLVNAAVHSYWGSSVESNELMDTAAQQFEMNVIVPLKLSVTVAREFWRDRKLENIAANRNIVNVSSTAGLYVYPNPGQAVYSASKAALNYLSFHMAGEFGAFGVRVNAVASNAFPSIVTTECAANSIHLLDREVVSGQILIIDSGGEAFYRPE